MRVCSLFQVIKHNTCQQTCMYELTPTCPHKNMTLAKCYPAHLLMRMCTSTRAVTQENTSATWYPPASFHHYFCVYVRELSLPPWAAVNSTLSTLHFRNLSGRSLPLSPTRKLITIITGYWQPGLEKPTSLFARQAAMRGHWHGNLKV